MEIKINWYVGPIRQIKVRFNYILKRIYTYIHTTYIESSNIESEVMKYYTIVVNIWYNPSTPIIKTWIHYRSLFKSLKIYYISMFLCIALCENTFQQTQRWVIKNYNAWFSVNNINTTIKNNTYFNAIKIPFSNIILFSTFIKMFNYL